MEEEKRHKEVHTLLRDVVAQELGTDPALGQPASAAKNRVLLLEPARKEKSHCSTHISQDPNHPLAFSRREERGKRLPGIRVQHHKHRAYSVEVESLGQQRGYSTTCSSLTMQLFGTCLPTPPPTFTPSILPQSLSGGEQKSHFTQQAPLPTIILQLQHLHIGFQPHPMPWSLCDPPPHPCSELVR